MAENPVQVIKYEGDNSTFVWKHPCEDFPSLSQLIVHESQEAIFFLNGQALDLFGPGRYTLETQTLPLTSRFLHRTVGDTTPFHAEVYFVNKVEQMGVKWGTDSKIQYLEPTYGFPLSIGASGEMSLRAQDARKLVLKLVGTESYLNQQKLVGFFRAFLMAHIKAAIAKVMKEQKIDIFQIDEHLLEFSEGLKALLVEPFAVYGVALEQFFVTNVVRPDGERQYEKYKELYFRQYADIAEAKLRQQTDIIGAQTQAQKTVIASEALAKKRAQEGYTYQQERGFDVSEKVAENQSVGQFSNLGIGLGAMAGVGGAIGGGVGSMVKQTMDSTLQPQPPAGPRCPRCGAPLQPGAKFCPSCGAPVSPRCPACGAPVAPGANFCQNCGKRLTEEGGK